MKNKKKILLIFIVILIPIIYFIFKCFMNDSTNYLKHTWNFRFPKTAEVEYVYISDLGFTGERERVIKIKNNSSDLSDTDLEKSSSQKDFLLAQTNVIDRIMSSAEMKNKKLDIDKSKLEFVNVKNKGSKNLVITYSQKDNCYYLFDEK